MLRFISANQFQRGDIVQSNQRLGFRLVVSVGWLLTFCVAAMGQTQSAASSAEFSPNRSVKWPLEQILPHIRQTPLAATEVQSAPATFDPHSRHDAHPKSSLQAVRAPGGSVAADRYVFGRMDLAAGVYPTAVAVGAFQTGGPQSIAVANNSYPGTISIMLANIDGTFQPQVDYPVGVEPSSIYVADLNGDHNLDLAVANWTGTISILLGNGDGTFKATLASPLTAANPTFIVAGDFNGDGKPDLAVGGADRKSVV